MYKVTFSLVDDGNVNDSREIEYASKVNRDVIKGLFGCPGWEVSEGVNDYSGIRTYILTDNPNHFIKYGSVCATCEWIENLP